MSDILYSPWRLKYILSQKDDGCIFCVKPSENDDEKQLIIYRSKHSFVIINTFPYNNGHLMVVPNKHVSSLSKLNRDELNDMFELVQLTERILMKAYTPDGINIGMNIGRAAGAGIDQHIHVHLVPRWNGDVNFMTTVSGTRVTPESFEQVLAKLKEQFDNESAGK